MSLNLYIQQNIPFKKEINSQENNKFAFHINLTKTRTFNPKTLNYNNIHHMSSNQNILFLPYNNFYYNRNCDSC
jgi:hypothetical protein